MSRPGDGLPMPERLNPRLDILPRAQLEAWGLLDPAPDLSLVLYGGTAVALHLGHRQSVDFDFFSAEPLDKAGLGRAFPFMRQAAILQDRPDTLVVSARMPSGSVKLSFFGGIGFGRIDDPVPTRDGTLLVASLNDLMATKLKAILDRAEAKDYRDIARMLEAGISLPLGLAAFRGMFHGEPAEVLRALGYFADGDLGTLPEADRTILRQARDRVGALPDVTLKAGLLPTPLR